LPVHAVARCERRENGRVDLEGNTVGNFSVRNQKGRLIDTFGTVT
jgi:hypothetical protein